MKVKLNPFGKGNASALLVTVFIIVVLTISIGGYMTYVTQQARFGARSQAWNMSMAVAEAGIEEGFEHLNDNTNSLGQDGWQQTSAGVYTLNRALNGTFTANYTVTINYTNPFNPSIYASATVTPPAIAQNKSPFFYATATPNQTTTHSSTTVSRAVSVVLYKPTFFNAAMVAKGSIDLNGNGVTVDSFDSGIAGQNVNGLWALSVSGDKGTVASVGGITNSVSIGNANIYGPLFTSPNETYGVGPNGAVGTHAWQAANGTGIEPGYYFNDANFTFPSTLAPYSTGIMPTSNSVVTAVGNTTNSQAFNKSLTPPPATLPAGESMSAVSTNTSIVTVSTYPGTQSGLTSNSTVVTTGTYPTGVGAVTTNCTGFTTSTSNPGAQPCETSSTFTTNVVSIPNPRPSGLSTNNSSTTSGSPPAAGSYIGNVTTNFNGSGKKITGYTYNAITGYSYPVTVYQYANQFTYSYLSYTWQYPTTTYTYTIYTIAPAYQTNSYDAVLSGDGSTYYDAGALGNTVVTGNNVTLVMPNGYSIGTLTIAPGASLNLYVGGTSFSVSGNGVINEPGVAGSLIIYAAPSVTSFSLGGNAAMAAVVVAPNANVTLHGGGNNLTDFSGAIMANNITLDGHFNVHYDAALGRIPSPGRYILKSWQEVPATASAH